MTREEATDLILSLIEAERDCEMHSYRRSYVFDRDQIKEQIINALTTKAALEKPAVVKGSCTRKETVK